jgi:NadR type nicotinamide-nucleotide adenylyltransferase
MRKIAIIGPESTGKSEIAQKLAQHYQTEWVPEYARFYLDRLDREYDQSDLLEIAKGQVAWEDQKIEFAQDYLFCDTNLIVIKIWSDYKYESTDEWIEQELANRTYDFHLLSNIDIAWTSDPQREHPTKREYFFDVYKKYLEDRKIPFGIVSGFEEERTRNAISVIENYFKE